MPESRWGNPIFYAGTVALFLVFFVIIAFFKAPTPLVIPAYLLAPVGGFRAVGFYFRRKPDARFLTKEKVDGTWYVWTPLDALAPYLIFGAMLLVIVIFGRR